MVVFFGLNFLASGCSNSDTPTPSGNLQKPVKTIEIEYWSNGILCPPDFCPTFDVKISLDGKGEYHSLQRIDLPSTKFFVPNKKLSKLFSILHPFRTGGEYLARDESDFILRYCATDAEILSVRWVFADGTENTLEQDFTCQAPADLTRIEAIMTALGLLPIASFVEQDFPKSSYRELLREWEAK
jgi:hypothetical protein